MQTILKDVNNDNSRAQIQGGERFGLDEGCKGILANCLNEIIRGAIEYGGDAGGAYYDKDGRKMLIKAMKPLCRRELDGYIIVEVSNVPMFAKAVETEGIK